MKNTECSLPVIKIHIGEGQETSTLNVYKLSSTALFRFSEDSLSNGKHLRVPVVYDAITKDHMLTVVNLGYKLLLTISHREETRNYRENHVMINDIKIWLFQNQFIEAALGKVTGGSRNVGSLLNRTISVVILTSTYSYIGP